MTPKETVLARFPHAEAQYNEGIFPSAQSATYQPASWAIYPTSGLTQPELGRGNTEEQAWDAAARKIQAEMVC